MGEGGTAASRVMSRCSTSEYVYVLRVNVVPLTRADRFRAWLP